MKVDEFITRLDEARYGRRMSEDTKPVAPAPSHAPTHTAQWKTKGTGKSSDEGEHTGPSGDAIKKKETSIPTPIAPKPSHAPTSTAMFHTDKAVKSSDEGEKISKEAIKEAVRRLIDSDEPLDYAELLGEAGHKAGCNCGFCQRMRENKGGGKKKEGGGGLEPVKEDFDTLGHRMRPGVRSGPMPIKRRLGGGVGRMGFRSPLRPKALGMPSPGMSGNQPSQGPGLSDSQRRPKNAPKSVQEQADALLEAPDQ